MNPPTIQVPSILIPIMSVMKQGKDRKLMIKDMSLWCLSLLCSYLTFSIFFYMHDIFHALEIMGTMNFSKQVKLFMHCMWSCVNFAYFHYILWWQWYVQASLSHHCPQFLTLFFARFFKWSSFDMIKPWKLEHSCALVLGDNLNFMAIIINNHDY